jgi:hypothetical protein
MEALTGPEGNEPFPAFTVSLVNSSVLQGGSAEFVLERLTLLESSRAPSIEAISKPSVTRASISSGEFTAVARVLFSGDGSDLIGAGMAAAAVEFQGLPAGRVPSLDGAQLYASPQLTSRGDGPTYVLLYPGRDGLGLLEDASSYSLSEGAAETLLFGDVNGDGIINAQDALGALALWLRKSAPLAAQLLSANADANGAVNLADALSIKESFLADLDVPVAFK